MANWRSSPFPNPAPLIINSNSSNNINNSKHLSTDTGRSDITMSSNSKNRKALITKHLPVLPSLWEISLVRATGDLTTITNSKPSHHPYTMIIIQTANTARFVKWMRLFTAITGTNGSTTPPGPITALISHSTRAVLQ